MSGAGPSSVSGSPLSRNKPRQAPRRLPLSCLPCRQHKLRCDRQLPCNTCTRYHRADQCLQNPAPARGRKNVEVPRRTNTGANTSAVEVPRRINTGANTSTGVDGIGAIEGIGAINRQLLISPNAYQAATNIIVNDGSVDHGLPPVSSEGISPEGDGGRLVENVHMEAAVQSMHTIYHLDTISNRHDDAAGAFQSVNHAPSVLFPQVLPLFQFANLGSNSILDMVAADDQKGQWKKTLVKFLPTRTQSDILLTYFIEHINWIFQTVHIPSFRKEYSKFWDGEIEKADLIWMSLLFTILSLSALYIPGDVVELVGLQRRSIRRYANTWHHASCQALQAGKFEERPTLIQLQTFSVTQLYWYATNNIEALNS